MNQQRINDFIARTVVADLTNKPEFPRSESTQELIAELVKAHVRLAHVFMMTYQARLILCGKKMPDRETTEACLDAIEAAIRDETV